jgi:glycosyltransferase involved in cell wall biosynthesis
MSDILFSIIIPTYNREKFIVKTIQSVLSQTYTNFELIIVDDGSTDNTEKVVREIEDQRIQYHQKENGERGAARNYGARLAKGKYVNFFDSDDLAYMNHLSEAMEMLHKFNTPEVFHLGYDIKNSEGRTLKRKNLVTDINNSLAHGNCLSCNGVFVRLDIVKKHPFSTIRALSASEDYLLWLQLAARYTIHSSLIVTSTIIEHSSRSVMIININALIKRKELMLIEMFSDKEIIKKYFKNKFKITQNTYSYISLHIALSKQSKKTALKYLFKAIKLSPIFIFKRRFFAIIKHLIF